MNWKKYFGPSTLVAAAFIGPGTLTTCTLAGVQTGYELLWVLLLAIGATILLQEMSARFGLATQAGLGEAFNQRFRSGVARYLVFFLVIGAILVGNAAYESGNISGGVLGFDLLLGEFRFWPLLIGAFCFALLYLGGYRWVERMLIALVILMSLCFLLTAILVRPDLSSVLAGFVPGPVDADRFLLVAALVGTTIVPYNLFLHASTISKKWTKNASLRDLRIENAVAILLGGLISLLIVITAAGSAEALSEVAGAKDLAVQLEPLFGTASRVIMGIGLLAAGISSALTAPLAAAYAARGLFSWPDDDRNVRFRMVWGLILGIGVLIASIGIKPVLIIQFAQVTNAILLPFVAGYLLYLCNSKELLGERRNGRVVNLFGGLVLLITVGLSVKSLGGVFGMW